MPPVGPGVHGPGGQLWECTKAAKLAQQAGSTSSQGPVAQATPMGRACWQHRDPTAPHTTLARSVSLVHCAFEQEVGSQGLVLVAGEEGLDAHSPLEAQRL